MNADVIIIGGGAAGYFTAINIAEMNPSLQVLILERGKEVLTKVKVSGGGRCNVTHAEFLPKPLSENYPRGKKELLGPFHSFMTGDTVAWFEARGVTLHTEEDGRMFPVTNDSQTIIDCFTDAAQQLGVQVALGAGVQEIISEVGSWTVRTKADTHTCKRLVVATGSSPKFWNVLATLGHTIVSPVPSLFTFNIDDERISDLPGVSTNATVQVLSEENSVLLESEGPLLITHWGMSGPAILKLSAWGARHLATMDYHFRIRVRWVPELSDEDVLATLTDCKLRFAKQRVHNNPQFELPKRLWKNLLQAAGVSEDIIWAHITKEQMLRMVQMLTITEFQVHGKSTFKEEFVTAGGVDLKEINFKTFESKLHPGLYFAGEVVNIDAITGGFNFQNAWTGGFMVASAITSAGL